MPLAKRRIGPPDPNPNTSVDLYRTRDSTGTTSQRLARMIRFLIAVGGLNIPNGRIAFARRRRVYGIFQRLRSDRGIV